MSKNRKSIISRKMNKKGVLFTLISLLLASLFVVLYYRDISIPLDYKVSPISTRVEVLNDYSKNFETYSDYVLEISSIRTMDALTDYMLKTNNFVSNFSCTFADMITNGGISNPTGTDTGSDIWINADTAILNTTKGSNNITINTTSVIIQKFKPQTTNQLKSITLELRRQGPETGNKKVYVEVRTEDCGKVGNIIASGLTENVETETSKDYIIKIKNQPILQQNNTYYLLVMSVDANQKFEIRFSDSGSSIPDGNLLANFSFNLNYINNKITNYSINSFLDKIDYIANNELNIETVSAVKDIRIRQDYSWDVIVSANFTLFITDNEASWERTIYVEKVIDINGMKDPSYVLNSLGAYNKTIKKTSVIEGTWNYTYFLNFYNNGEYRHNSKAPNFLMRYQNITSASDCCGIESFVNASKVSIKLNTSYMDRFYWTSKVVNCTELLNISTGEVDGNFKLETIDMIRYLENDTNSKTTVLC